ncbi:hypothetical protein EJ03DRAFT_323477 [Teratosphaeria nubilosa]|uniref:DNA/RNA-binding protein Kin17 WH-like domain-containing protein n=1 Tax=Teratosphaeria nubilosa TaxID=161662 RepID=A0A6G1LMY6_9PEZI|nr:hypothetical protein EJ03DRAFT_323477 [Teratosphaeria nubilosa]
MPISEVKYLANKMKAKGLQRLRWYCQICEKQCRDENGFKQHTMSEGHVRAMLAVGEDPRKYINEYSNQFKRDFLQLLKTAHGEKKVHMNNFYQEYIRDKEHVHMNATKWPSLTEFAKYLGKEGICKVEEGERGLEIQWIDNSSEAIQRKEDIKKKERLAKGDEDLEARLLEQQIKKAKEAAAEKEKQAQDARPSLEPSAGPVKVSLSLGVKTAPKQDAAKQQSGEAPIEIESFSAADSKAESKSESTKPAEQDDEEEPASTKEAAPKIGLSLAAKSKAGNPMMKKNPFAKKGGVVVPPMEKKMSNAERIMKEEIERKRLGDQRGFGGGSKRQRLG